jgi:glycosyltransferase involved in cell wall biosynthesis
MKILMLTPYLPYPPASGGQIRTLNLLKYLSASNEITLVALYKNEKEKAYAEKLEKYCREIHVCKRAENPWQPSNVLKSVFTVLPFLIVRNFSNEAKQTIHQLLKQESFDVIHAETFYIMPHLPQTTTPVLLVEQTIEFKVYQHFVSNLSFLVRYLLSLDILKLRFWEIFYWKKANQVAAVSYSDKAIIDSCIDSTNTEVIPNGAGDEMFVKTPPEKNLNKPTLLFVGNFSWLQNTEAAEYLVHDIMPRLLKRIPNVRLKIVGQNIHSKLAITQSETIELVDIAPDDSAGIKEHYRDATLFVAPIFGPGGTRLKILAAMASGLPIVSSKTGVEGLNVKHKREVMVADSPDDFVSSIEYILSHPEEFKSMQQRAHELVVKEYSWSAIAKKLEIVYAGITRS